MTISTPVNLETGWEILLGAIRKRLSPAEAAGLSKARELTFGQAPDPGAVSCFARGIGIAEILNGLGLEGAGIAAGFLVPFAEDGIIELAAIEKGLTPEIARLVQGTSRIAILKDHRKVASDTGYADKLRKMLLNMAEDPRVVVLRLADQLYLLRAAKAWPEDLRHALGDETLELFAPLAGRLGTWQVKWELEDRAFSYLEPETYRRIAAWLDQGRAERERYIAAVIARLNSELDKMAIRAEVYGRPKHIYSIHTKMRAKGLDFGQIYDTLALRILVDEVADCYTALGVVHGLWRQIPEEFDDYIAKPKANMYRSLHTAVIGPEERSMEVQIRTHVMHRHAELGVAAHWRYKEGSPPDAHPSQHAVWLKGFLDTGVPGESQIDLIERFKSQAFQDRIYVLTPQGDVIDLPCGATPLDFAYAVHTEVGHRCRGAKVDGIMRPLVEPLRSGQRVEILMAREALPSRDWLNAKLGYLRSREARDKVRRWFKQQDFEQHVNRGRTLLERECRRTGGTEANIGALAKHFGFKRPDNFLAALGRGDLSPGRLDPVLSAQSSPPSAEPRAAAVSAPRRGMGAGLLVLGVSNLLTRMAGCCRPVPDDPIAGYITQGQGIAIHRRDCFNLTRLGTKQPQRLIDVAWGTASGRTYTAEIVVDADDRRGLLRDVSDAVADAQVNILAVNTLSDCRTQSARMTFTLEIGNADQLDRVIHRIARIPDVRQARRKR